VCLSCILEELHAACQSADVKTEPWSVNIAFGNPVYTVVQHFENASQTDLAVEDGKNAAEEKVVAASTIEG
jgi:hypothetical protein